MMSQPVMELLFTIVVVSLPVATAAGMIAVLGKGLVTSLTGNGKARRTPTPTLRPSTAKA